MSRAAPRSGPPHQGWETKVDGPVTSAVVRGYVIGAAGAGKTTLSRSLSERLGVPHVELDAIVYQANWRRLPDDEFRRRVADAIAGDRWIVDGNWAVVRPLILDRATTVVWLDYERWMVMQRVVRRSLVRAARRQELWNGNRDSPRALLRPYNPIRWAWSQHARKRREYGERYAAPEHAHLEVIRLRTPAEARRWLETLPQMS